MRPSVDSSTTFTHPPQSTPSKHLTHNLNNISPQLQHPPHSLQDTIPRLDPHTIPRPLLQLCVLLCVVSIFCGTPVTSAYPSLKYGTASSSPIFGQLVYEQVSLASTEYGTLTLDVGQRTVVSSEDATLGTFMILFGLVLVFFGFKLIRVTLFLTGFLSWAIVVIIIIATSRWDLAWMLFKPSYYYFWMWLLAGFIGGVLSFRFWDLGMIIAGGFGGFALGMGIIGAANDSIPMFGRYILLIGVIVLGATVAVFWERLSIILATSFAGAFMVMFGVDEFLQVGYREMMVIFEFAGKALTYHPDKKVYIMIGSSLALACLGIVWELLLHRTPFWEDRKVLFSVYGQPFGKRPLRLVGQKIMNGVRRKTAEDVLQGGDDSYVDGNGHVVVGESQSQLPVSSELEEVTVEKPSEGSDTEVSNDSGISSMTPSSYRDHTDANTELPIDSALPPITLSPIQIVIDDAEFEDSSSDKTVPVGTHIESACRISTDSTATHHTTITTTTIATASRSISSSEITSHQHASSTPDAL